MCFFNLMYMIEKNIEGILDIPKKADEIHALKINQLNEIILEKEAESKYLSSLKDTTSFQKTRLSTIPFELYRLNFKLQQLISNKRQ